MKIPLLAGVLLLSVVSAEYCYNEVASHCSVSGDEGALAHCSAKYSSAHTVMGQLENFVRQHLSHSFQYLLMSTNFGNYEKNREGLAKLFRKLSDDTWEDSIDIIKYMAKRGSKMGFGELGSPEPNKNFKPIFEMHELESLSRALDMSKALATKAHHIHGEVTKKNDKYHDADTINYIEDKFVEKHTKIIRDLAGHTNELSNLIKGASDPSLSIFLFDEHLKTLY